MKRSWTTSFAALAAAMSLAACTNMMAPGPPPPPPAPVAAVPGPPPAGTLYAQLGGEPAINAVIDKFIGIVAADPRINRFFAHADIPRLKSGLVTLVCQASGGPCVYNGRPMRVIHHNMHVTDADFDALVQDLVAAMTQLNVPPPLQQQVLGLLGPLKPDVVNV
jgi:hemoglobin